MNHKKLEDLLIDDWTWRKLEISSLIILAEEHEAKKEHEVLLKSIILLLYAHWEGYIKKSSKMYLKYISDSKKFLNELTPNFKAVALKNLISQCIESKESLTLQNEVSVINSLSKAETKKFQLSIDIDDDFDKSIIDTNSNLKPKVFKNIIAIIGLNYKTQYEIKENHIDNLLANRNSIGHGNKNIISDKIFELEINDIKKLRDIIISIIENFRDEIIEYSKEKYYLIENQNKLEKFLKEKENQLEAVFKEIDTRYKK